MTLAYSDIVITAVILCLVVFAVHRYGQRNPVATGDVDDRLNRGEVRFRALEERLENTATKAELGVLAGQVRSLEEHAASSGEVLALAAQVRSLGESGKRTEDGVNRIERILIEKALK